MSYDTNRNWFYQLYGRYIHLWQLIDGARVDTLGSFKIRVPAERIRPQLIYPDEDITNGLRVEYTSFTESDLFVAEAIETTTAIASGTGISFDPGPAATISDTADGFSDFAQSDKIRVIGSASNDGDYTLTPSGTVDEDTLTITGTFTTEAAGESITIYQIPKEVTGADISETSHVNLNRQLSLALVDYLRAKLAESVGQMDLREYYMKQFYSKLGDRSNNLRKVSVQNVVSPYALK